MGFPLYPSHTHILALPSGVFGFPVELSFAGLSPVLPRCPLPGYQHHSCPVASARVSDPSHSARCLWYLSPTFPQASSHVSIHRTSHQTHTCLASSSTTALACVSTPTASCHPIHPLLCLQNPRTARGPAVRSYAPWRYLYGCPPLPAFPTRFPLCLSHTNHFLVPDHVVQFPTVGLFPHVVHSLCNPLSPVLLLANSYSSCETQLQHHPCDIGPDHPTPASLLPE